MGERRESDLAVHVRHVLVIVVLAVSVFAMVPAPVAAPGSECGTPEYSRASRNAVWITSAYQSVTYAMVHHRSYSHVYVDDVTSVTKYIVTTGSIDRRYCAWGDAALLQSFTSLRSYNVNVAYPNNEMIIRGSGSGEYIYDLYHYGPTRGSGDGVNSVGWTQPYFYVSPPYDLPTSMTNHVYRTGGTYVTNSVYSSKAQAQITFGEAREWLWVRTSNAVEYWIGTGREVTVYDWSYSWDIWCEYWVFLLWCGRWVNDFYSDQTTFYIYY